ncbi:Hypothetical_protein [Hexamita inflata]|uniref:Hypothetical_protein n=1 Tax=Hexamita inflata TaxID=28002 RepID=A0AA86R2B1_9EUKA|nr:Hypothetical protein HINF_LOCUS52567 [Hexamita inflata]
MNKKQESKLINTNKNNKYQNNLSEREILDVTFAVEANICNAFKGKILKYGGTYMLITFLPEITDSFLSKHCCLVVSRQRRSQPSAIEDLEHERLRKTLLHNK